MAFGKFLRDFQLFTVSVIQGGGLDGFSANGVAGSTAGADHFQGIVSGEERFRVLVEGGEQHFREVFFRRSRNARRPGAFP